MKKPSAPTSNLRDRFTASPLNLRTKLVLGNIIIVLVALAGMGYYVYLRTREANTFLTTELEQSVRQKAAEKLSSTASEQAVLLNLFFTSISEDINNIGTTTESLLSREESLSVGNYWDAATALSRLPSGSWDNSNSEIASVFIPAGVQLTPALVAELNTIKHTEFTVPPILENRPDIIAIYFGGTSKETIYFPNIDLAAIVPPDFDVTGRPWFVAAASAVIPESNVVWSAPYLDAALNGIVVTCSTPVFDSTGKFRGVAAMDVQLNRITDIVSNIRIGETGYAFLIDRDNRLIALPQGGYDDLGANLETLPLGGMIDQATLTNVPPEFFDVITRMSAGENGLQTITINGSERYIAYHPIPEVGYGLAILVPTEEMLTEAITARALIARETRNTISLSVILVAIILLAAALAASGMGGALTAPLSSLTRTAEEITGGNLEALSPENTEAELGALTRTRDFRRWYLPNALVRRRDEIGTLAKALDAMTSTLRGLIQSLEQRIQARTAELEHANLRIQRRAEQFEAISLVSRTTAAIQNLDELLPRVTQLVSEEFGFYHVGIFLLDEGNRFAVLRAANSQGGRKMLEQNHRLEVGQTGIVGFVAHTGQARIALDVGADTVYFNNPDLPATRSEMALPLKIRGQVIGVLDVQSIEPGAFTQSDADTLAIMADQIAIAIENARLFGESQQALAEVQALYTQYLNQEWGAFTQKGTKVGYQRSLIDGRELSAPVVNDEIRHVLKTGELLIQNPEDPNDEATIVMPVKLRGQMIGVLNIKTPAKGRRWSDEEVNMIRVVSDRLALALENARLFEETTRTAEREKLVSDITTNIRSTNDPQLMIEMAVAELRRVLGVSRVEIIPQRVTSSES